MLRVLFTVLLLGISLSGGAADCWLQNRISRNWRTPINRPPLNRHELDDDVDYYSDAYLAEMTRDGINGLWISAEGLDGLVASSNRLEKLRRTVAKCAAYGIRIWLQANDPVAVASDDPRLKAHPEWFRKGPDWSGRYLWCSSEPGVLNTIREQTARLFKAVPGLGGIINIMSGEGLTTCFSMASATRTDYAETFSCPRCDAHPPWQLHNAVCEAYVSGMREGNPDARLLSWLYHPAPNPERNAWVADCARHQPEGMTIVYNFESGIVREQLGRRHVGGDYWLSVPGPSRPFREVAAAGAAAGRPVAAKIQMGCSHEMATLPYIPAPGLLYRKYREMKRLDVRDVLLCWYFGNMPGTMNKAAGWLRDVDFGRESEDAFLLRLAASDWGGEAVRVRRIWTAFTEAYSDYPLDNNMQYYGPFAAGVIWPLMREVRLAPLARTWIPTEPTSGDFIAECLGDFTLDEVTELSGRMAARAKSVDDELTALEKALPRDVRRQRDIGVMRAFRNQVVAAHDVFSFYQARRDGDERRMAEIVGREIALTEDMLRLAAADERLGWHSEAEARLYSPESLQRRLAELKASRTEVPDSESVEVPRAYFGEDTIGSNVVWRADMRGEDCVVAGVAGAVDGIVVSVTDEFGTVFPKRKHVDVRNGKFRVVFERFHPGRILILSDTYPQRAHASVLWPVGRAPVLNRLNLPWISGPSFGRLCSRTVEGEGIK